MAKLYSVIAKIVRSILIKHLVVVKWEEDLKFDGCDSNLIEVILKPLKKKDKLKTRIYIEVPFFISKIFFSSFFFFANLSFAFATYATMEGQVIDKNNRMNVLGSTGELRRQ